MSHEGTCPALLGPVQEKVCRWWGHGAAPSCVNQLVTCPLPVGEGREMGRTEGYSVSEKELKVTVGTAARGSPVTLCAQELCPRDCTHMAYGLHLALLVLPLLEHPHLPASTLFMFPGPSPLTSRGRSCSKFLPREISRHLGRSELARWL